MNSDTLLNLVLNAAIGLVLLVWISYRQLRWTPVIPEKMWRMPAILAILGIFLLAKTGLAHVTGQDVAVLAIETVISLALGSVMGLIAHFRPISDAALQRWTRANAASSRPHTGATPALETRNGWFGMALWIVLIATRVAVEFWAHANNSALLTSTGVILLTVALNRGMRTLVIIQRAQRHPALADRGEVAA
jgi:hypothetical protein